MARMSTGLQEALLIIEILERIPRNRLISAEELRQALITDGFDVSRRTMQRTLKTMVDCDRLGVECDMRERPFGYRRSVAHANFGLERLTPSEGLLLRLSEERLRHQIPAGITKALSHLYDEAREVLAEGKNGSRNAAWLQKVCTVPSGLPQMASKVKPRIFEAVSEALYRNVELDVSYVNNEGKAIKERVAPLGLVQQEARLYLVCRFEGYENFRHLALHRMRDAKVTDIPFVRPKGFSLKAYVSDRHFNFTNGEKVHWKVQFTNEATARNLEETPFNTTQRVTKTRQGVWQLDVDIEDSIWLDGWIAAFKERADIIQSSKQSLKAKKY